MAHIRSSALALCILLASQTCLRSQDSLQQQIESFIATQPATIGVAIDVIPVNAPTRHCGVHENDRFIAMSTIKFPICVTALHAVDQHVLSFKQRVRFDSADLERNTYSPICDAHSKPFTADMRTTLSASVSLSDNNATDKIIDAMGGLAAFSTFLSSRGYDHMGVGTTYRDMQHDSLILNWTTPAEMNRLVRAAYEGTLLSKQNTTWLFDQMRRTPSSPGRLKGKLPRGTVVAHKTGTYFTDAGLADLEAVNDIGIIEVPKKGIVVISVYVNHSHMSPQATEAAIASIARMAYDALVGKGPSK